MSTLRLRRLAADYEKLQEFVRRHPRLKLVSTSGEHFEIEIPAFSLDLGDSKPTIN